jgi:hypothetical protein
MKKAGIFEELENQMLLTATLDNSSETLDKIMDIYDKCTSNGAKMNTDKSKINIK